MYFFLSDEFSRPDKLNAFDQQFEIQLPMKNAKLKFNSKVKSIVHRIWLKWDTLSPFLLQLKQQYKEIAMEMRNYYFGNKRISNETFYELSKLMSDIWFNYGIDVSARIQANKSTGQTFFYTWVWILSSFCSISKLLKASEINCFVLSRFSAFFFTLSASDQ